MFKVLLIVLTLGVLSQSVPSQCETSGFTNVTFDIETVFTLNNGNKLLCLRFPVKKEDKDYGFVSLVRETKLKTSEYIHFCSGEFMDNCNDAHNTYVHKFTEDSEVEAVVDSKLSTSGPVKIRVKSYSGNSYTAWGKTCTSSNCKGEGACNSDGFCDCDEETATCDPDRKVVEALGAIIAVIVIVVLLLILIPIIIIICCCCGVCAIAAASSKSTPASSGSVVAQPQPYDQSQPQPYGQTDGSVMTPV